MIRQLTATKKTEYLPLLFNKQKGRCLYCVQPFEQFTDAVFDHLNNKRLDNRLENLCLAHQSCNIKKVAYMDYQLIANAQLKTNEDQVLSVKKNIEDHTPNDASSEIQINQVNYPIVEQFITEKVNTDGQIEYKDALNSCVYKCRSITGYGSAQSVRTYLDTLTCSVAPFMIIKDPKTKKKIIVKREGN